ncbi:hypothetical protein E2562_017998, partial [Oryza meyeriana var. granulata]
MPMLLPRRHLLPRPHRLLRPLRYAPSLIIIIIHFLILSYQILFQLESSAPEPHHPSDVPPSVEPMTSPAAPLSAPSPLVADDTVPTPSADIGPLEEQPIHPPEADATQAADVLPQSLAD